MGSRCKTRFHRAFFAILAVAALVTVVQAQTANGGGIDTDGDGVVDTYLPTPRRRRSHNRLASMEWLFTSGVIAIVLKRNSNGADAPPEPDPERSIRMARRRYQRGALRLEGDKWVLRWREDVSNAQGEIQRVERRSVVGTLAECPTKALARRASDQQLGTINPIDYRPGRVISVEEFAHVYLTDAVPMMKRSTQISVRAIVNRHITPFFRACRMDEVRGRLPQAFVVELRRKGLKRKTVLNTLSVLSRMLEVAIEFGYLAHKLDLGTLHLPPDEVDVEPRCFTAEEAQRIVDNAPVEWRECFALMAYLGIRAGEAIGLTWDHVDLEVAVLRIRQAVVMGKVQTVKSKTSKRDLPLPAHLVRMLADYRARWEPNAHGLLFVSSRGTPLWSTNVRLYRFYPLLERLGIPHGGLHAFRHGVATNAMAAGAPPTVVRDTLGHASLTTTLRYTHRVTEDQRKAVEAVSAALLRHSAAPARPKLLRIK